MVTATPHKVLIVTDGDDQYLNYRQPNLAQMKHFLI